MPRENVHSAIATSMDPDEPGHLCSYTTLKWSLVYLVVLVVYTPCPGVSTLKSPRVSVQPLHTISGQAIQRFTRTRCLHSRKDLTTSAHARGSGTVRMAVERIFMINHNESDLLRPGIEPGTFDSQSNALSTELTGRALYMY